MTRELHQYIDSMMYGAIPPDKKEMTASVFVKTCNRLPRLFNAIGMM